MVSDIDNNINPLVDVKKVKSMKQSVDARLNNESALNESVQNYPADNETENKEVKQSDGKKSRNMRNTFTSSGNMKYEERDTV
jgi:hypothetical protein